MPIQSREFIVAAAKHKDLKVTTPPENAAVPHGVAFKVVAEAETEDGGAGPKSSVFVRVFYRVNGFPFAVDVYNDEATVGGASGKKVELLAAKTTAFAPFVKKSHSVRMLVWDHKSKIAKLDEVKQKVSRFRVE